MTDIAQDDLYAKAVAMNRRELLQIAGFALPALFASPAWGADRSSRQELGVVLRQLQESLPCWMQAYKVPGASMTVLWRGEPAWSGEFGVRHRDQAAPVDAQTIFEAASLSKPLFAYQVLQLAADGKLDLDRPLQDYLPEPYAPEAPLVGLITARMVLTHTTGLPNWRKGDNRTAPLYLLNPPGETFGYSGEGFILLQTAVAAITATETGDYLKKILLDPIGMMRSDYRWQAAYIDNYAHGHDRDGNPADYRFKSRANTASSLYTTPKEYARYLQVMMGSLQGPLSRSGIDRMLEPGSTRQQGFYYGLGWGLCMTLEGRKIVYHGGANGSGHRCLCAFERESGHGFVLMTNARGGSDVRGEVERSFFPGAGIADVLGR